MWRDERERLWLQVRLGPEYRSEFREIISAIETASQALARLEELLTPLSKRLTAGSPPRSKGAPRREDVRVLLCQLADLMMELNLPVHKSRSGIFVRIAEILHPDTRDPHDPVTIGYPLIRKSIDLVRDGQA
jgi:hypothetical protein